MQQDIQTHWNTIFKRGFEYRYLSPDELSELLNRTSLSDGKVLDIGCGTGQLTRELYHRGFHVVGVDVSPEAIARARSLTRYVDYLQLDFETDDLRDLGNAYDLITCKLVFAFMKDRPRFVERTKELIAPHGAFVIITPTSGEVEAGKEHTAVDHEDTMKLLQAHFRTVDSYQENRRTTYVCK